MGLKRFSVLRKIGLYLEGNIGKVDIQCPAKECANITHSLIELYLAGNLGKVDIQCPPMECANNCTLHNRTLDVLTCP